MNSRQVKSLAVVLFALLAIFFSITLSERESDSIGTNLLFPDLRAQINDIDRLSITKSDSSMTVTNASGAWVLVERDNYPADTGKLRQLLLALADAKALERKTSNPEMYQRLGVEDISDSSSGTEIQIAGSDVEASLIVGKLAQRKYRYARIPGQPESWLINQNPTLPSDAAGWLLPDIVDVDTSRIQSVEVKHADGEEIRIEKEDSESANFVAPDIPSGRELRYPSIANSMAGVLSGLTLADVAKARPAERRDDPVTTLFTTFDGLELTVDSYVLDENTWISVSASGTESDEAAAINARVDGWEYQVANHKGDQFRRRWSDILKTEE